MLDNAATHKTRLIQDWLLKRPRWHLHFTPTSLSAHFLEREGVPAARIVTVGNTITDALLAYGPPRVAIHEREGVLMTSHRASNVDSPERLARIEKLFQTA